MANIDLSLKGISIEGSEFKDFAKNLQGNILKSHGRGHTSNIFFQFNPGKTSEAKRFIKACAKNDIISAFQQREDSKSFKNDRKQRNFIGFYLSAEGYRYLEVPENQIPSDSSFRNGMKKGQGLLIQL